jgi:hypothetical protein
MIFVDQLAAQASFPLVCPSAIAESRSSRKYMSFAYNDSLSSMHVARHLRQHPNFRRTPTLLQAPSACAPIAPSAAFPKAE